MVDTGVDLNHTDLAANILNSGINCINSVGGNCNSGTTAQDYEGHGSHVAGIIAGVRGNHVYFTSGQETNLNMQGVAYSAKILPVKVMDSSGSGDSVDIAAGINYASNHGAKVINLSLGADGTTIHGADPFPTDITPAIQNAMNNNILVFAASGNSGGASPIWPAMNASTLNGSISTGAVIAVGSVDANNVISSFSNKCGAAMTWCLVAPGEHIHSTYWDSGSSYAIMSGTSMATPFASGAAAILLSEFPSLTSRQVAELLLETATDLGTPGVDSVYGHGLINLDAASNPVGQVIVPLGNGGSSPLASSNIVLSSAFGKSLKNSGLVFAVLDSYNRAFTVGLASITGSNASKTRDSDSFDSFAEPTISKVHMSVIGESLSLGFASVDSGKLPGQPGQDKAQTTYFSMVSQGDGIKQSVNYNIPVAQIFGFGGVKGLDGGTFLGDALHGNPYLALSNYGFSSISDIAFADNHIHTNFAMFSGKNADSGDETSGVAAEVAAEFSGLAVASQFGSVGEKGSFLGSHSSGAFAIGGQANPTWFYNLSTSFNITGNTKLFGLFSEGITKTGDAANSLISRVSEIKSQSLAAGIMRDSNFFENDLLGFAVSSPLHVISGRVNITVPYGVDSSGNIYTQNQALNLAPTGVETDMEVFYKVPVESSLFSFGAMHKIQPGNVQDTASEDLVMFKIINRF